MNKLPNKWTYLYVVQGLFNGWEDLTAAETSHEARGYLRDYRANDPGRYRMIVRREPRG